MFGGNYTRLPSDDGNANHAFSNCDRCTAGACGIRRAFLILGLVLVAVAIYSFYILNFDFRLNPLPRLLGRVGSGTSEIIYGKRAVDDSALNECILREFPDGWTDAALDIVKDDLDPLKECNRSFKPLTKLINGIVVLLDTTDNSTGTIRCRARSAYVISDRDWRKSEWHDIDERFGFTHDVIHVQCTRSNYSDTFYEFIHTQVYRKRSVEVEKERVKIRDNEEKKASRPSVHIFVLDSVGNSAGLRALSRTTSYLRDAFGAINFRHLNKVGHNSRPNGAALLMDINLSALDRGMAGLPSIPAEYDMDYFCDELNLDDKKFILREYEKQRGYVSLQSEDWDRTLFVFPNCTGFHQQPVSHYLRPFFLLYDEGGYPPRSQISKHMNEENCYERFHFLLDYFEQFLNIYPDMPKATMTWTTFLAHNDNDNAFHADAKFRDFFERHRDEFDDSFVFFMSDHGIRWGPILDTDVGATDLNNPMLFMSVPKWMRSDKELRYNMRRNSGKLLTQFDVHATLTDILENLPGSNFTNFGALPAGAIASRGSSLLRPLPAGPRNCFTLPIPFANCLCEREMTDVHDSFLVHQAGLAVASRVNSIIAHNNLTTHCAELSYDKVESAKVVARTDGIFRVEVTTRPGAGRFQAWLRDVGPRGRPSFVHVSQDFVRLNSYGQDADCIKLISKEDMRPYCYCRWP